MHNILCVRVGAISWEVAREKGRNGTLSSSVNKRLNPRDKLFLKSRSGCVFSLTAAIIIDRLTTESSLFEENTQV